ncbi:MarR family winged helix-turn-helix transcriptional regulator [Roseobacter sp. EG26]|uniref:MarR family winged helix-turn-helix transcriptional regulator n=1 Tax=Roseobacter sp. EG26 TaxID=3412477 RepID=UPI003CE5964A
MSSKRSDVDAYQLSEQAGFNLRRANQRHVAIFSKLVKGLTPTQFAALARLNEHGAISQNRLGRLTAMDSATIKGVVERLKAKGLVLSRSDLKDRRMRLVELSDKGRAVFETELVAALHARTETLAPLTEEEAKTFEALLSKLV